MLSYNNRARSQMKKTIIYTSFSVHLINGKSQATIWHYTNCKYITKWARSQAIGCGLIGKVRFWTKYCWYYCMVHLASTLTSCRCIFDWISEQLMICLIVSLECGIIDCLLRTWLLLNDIIHRISSVLLFMWTICCLLPIMPGNGLWLWKLNLFALHLIRYHKNGVAHW